LKKNKKKTVYEENLRSKKALIGKSDSEITSLQLGNILMSSWLAETSLILPSNKTAIKNEPTKYEKEREIKETTKTSKKLMGEVERYKNIY